VYINNGGIITLMPHHYLSNAIYDRSMKKMLVRKLDQKFNSFLPALSQ
jgi:hypothetical protein